MVRQNCTKRILESLLIGLLKCITYFIDNAIFKKLSIVLRDSDCAVSKQFGHHFQAYPSVKAPGSIGVSGNVGKDSLFIATWKDRRREILSQARDEGDRSFASLRMTRDRVIALALRRLFYLVSERGLQKIGLVVQSGCKPPGFLGQNTVFWQGGLQPEYRQMAIFCKPVCPTLKTFRRERISSQEKS